MGPTFVKCLLSGRYSTAEMSKTKCLFLGKLRGRSRERCGEERVTGVCLGLWEHRRGGFSVSFKNTDT